MNLEFNNELATVGHKQPTVPARDSYEELKGCVFGSKAQVK
jgi:hypothetical protein